MKKHMNNPYATNKGGMIKAPKNPSADDPKVKKITAGSGGDLRVKRGK